MKKSSNDKKLEQTTELNKIVEILSKNVISMSTTFIENQTTLISIRDLISSFNSIMEPIKNNIKQNKIIENDINKLFSGLNEVKHGSVLITKINDQIIKLQKQVDTINKYESILNVKNIKQILSDNINSTKINSQMIIKIAQRIDELKNNLKSITDKTKELENMRLEINKIKENVNKFTNSTEDITITKNYIIKLKNELKNVSDKIRSTSTIFSEIENIKQKINFIHTETGKIKLLNNAVLNLKHELNDIAVNTRNVTNLNKKILSVEDEVNSIIKSTRSIANTKDDIKSIKIEFINFKNDMFKEISSIENNVSTLSNSLKKSNNLVMEFNKKTSKVFDGLNEIRSITKSSSSNEIISLLRLSKYQSSIRLYAESRYGNIDDLKNMVSQTSEIIKLLYAFKFESDDIEIPNEIIQWSISKIFDCVYKWEIKFKIIFRLLNERLNSGVLKENIKIEQIRDSFGIRAVDIVRKEFDLLR